MDKKHIVIGIIVFVFVALAIIVPSIIEGIIMFNAFDLVNQDMNKNNLLKSETVTEQTIKNTVSDFNNSIKNSNSNLNSGLNSESTSKTFLIVGAAAIVGVLVIWFISTHNKFIKLLNKLKQSESGIDIYLKQRFDLIPNLVEIVKSYANHEENVLEEITRLRQDFKDNDNNDLNVSAKINNELTKVLAVVESYPELKANEGFLKLQDQLSKVESQLQAARRIYNLDVTEYNIKVHSIPSNIIAHLFSFKEKALFEINESEKENVVIKV